VRPRKGRKFPLLLEFDQRLRPNYESFLCGALCDSYHELYIYPRPEEGFVRKAGREGYLEKGGYGGIGKRREEGEIGAL
jgi:hypothetical protein